MITASDCYHRILCRLKMKNSTTNTIIWLWTVNKIDHRSLRRVVIDWAIRHKPVWHIIWYSIWVTWNELLYHTCLWNRRICIYVIVHPRSHMLTMLKKSNPCYNKIWLCWNVIIWYSQICFSVIFIHIVIISKYLEKMHLFILLSITSHWFNIFLVSSKSTLALFPFKA